MFITFVAIAALSHIDFSGQQAQVAKSTTIEAQSANRHYSRGWDAIRAQNWAEATREFQAAVDADPDFSLAYYSLGRARMGEKDFAGAIQAYLKCRDRYLNAPGDRFANQLEARHRLDERILQYRNAINQARNSGGATSGVSQSQNLYIRQLETELMRLEQARDRNVTNITLDAKVPYFVPMSLGAAYFRSGKFPEAEREYKDAIAANAESGETHNNLAVLYLTTGRYDEADAEVKAAEKVGFKVNEALKGDIRKALRGGVR